MNRTPITISAAAETAITDSSGANSGGETTSVKATPRARRRAVLLDRCLAEHRREHLVDARPRGPPDSPRSTTIATATVGFSNGAKAITRVLPARAPRPFRRYRSCRRRSRRADARLRPQRTRGSADPSPSPATSRMPPRTIANCSGVNGARRVRCRDSRRRRLLGTDDKSARRSRAPRRRPPSARRRDHRRPVRSPSGRRRPDTSARHKSPVSTRRRHHARKIARQVDHVFRAEPERPRRRQSPHSTRRLPEVAKRRVAEALLDRLPQRDLPVAITVPAVQLQVPEREESVQS